MYGYPPVSTIGKLREIFRVPTSPYSFGEALDLGLMVDVSAAAREVGFRRATVYLSRAAWGECVQWSDTDRVHQREGSRLWDLLWAALDAEEEGGYQEGFAFKHWRIPHGETRHRSIRLVCHIRPCKQPGHLVVSIMTLGEDH